jgi:hypothetical protein
MALRSIHTVWLCCGLSICLYGSAVAYLLPCIALLWHIYCPFEILCWDTIKLEWLAFIHVQLWFSCLTLYCGGFLLVSLQFLSHFPSCFYKYCKNYRSTCKLARIITYVSDWYSIINLSSHALPTQVLYYANAQHSDCSWLKVNMNIEWPSDISMSLRQRSAKSGVACKCLSIKCRLIRIIDLDINVSPM